MKDWMIIIKEFREKKHENRVEGDRSEIGRRPGGQGDDPRDGSSHHEAEFIRK